MDEKLDRLLESLQQLNVSVESLRVSLAALIEISGDHEKRLRLLERWQQNLTPVLAILTFTLGALFTQALTRFL
jgi:hypothetical protein